MVPSADDAERWLIVAVRLLRGYTWDSSLFLTLLGWGSDGGAPDPGREELPSAAISQS